MKKQSETGPVVAASSVAATPDKTGITDGAEARCVREQLLHVAERLFAERGVAETSVRAITTEAGVNVAAINYYFGSKEDLFREIVSRRLQPLNEARLGLLDACYEKAIDGRPAVEDVLYALAAPSIELGFKYPNFALLYSQLRMPSDKELWHDYATRQLGFLERFLEAFAASRPDLPLAEVEMRLNFVLGAIHNIWARSPLPGEESPERVLASYLAFYTAALRTPSSDLYIPVPELITS
jgi:AcrR family transcriptional regulator